MKRLSAVILLILITLCFCGCSGATRLSELTGTSAEGIEEIRYGYIIQSYAAPVNESRFNTFFKAINVRYEECRDIYSLIYSDDCNETTCFYVYLKNGTRMYLYHLPNKKMCAVFDDGENDRYYLSCEKVYIPYYILLTKKEVQRTSFICIRWGICRSIF